MTAQEARSKADDANLPYTLTEILLDIARYAGWGNYTTHFGNPVRGNTQRPWAPELTEELERLGYTVSAKPYEITVSW